MTAPVDGFPVGRARQHDLRLAGAALGAWLMSWAALHLTWWTSVLVAAAALVVAATVARSRVRFATVLVAALLGVACGGLATAGRTVTRDSPVLDRVVHERTTAPVTLVVSDDPRLMRGGRGYVIAADLVRIAGPAHVTGANSTAARPGGPDPGPASAPARGGATDSARDAAPARGGAGSGRDAGPEAGVVDNGRNTAREPGRAESGGDPAPERGPTDSGRGSAAERRAAADLAGAADVSLDVRVTVLATGDGWVGLLPGQRVRTTARFMPPRGGDLRAATLSVSGTPELLGRPPWYQRGAGGLRAGLQRASRSVSGPAGGLLPGLVIGDTSRLDPGLAEDFKATGMTHLVAVSGANCAIMIGCVLFVAAWCRAGPRTTAVLGALALIGFVLLARPSPSVLRAAAMGTLGLVGLASGRARAAVPALAAGVLALVVGDPELSGDMGFALSVTATAGLLLLAPGWRDALRRRGVPAGLAEALAVPAAAQVACGPLIAVLSSSVTLVAVPANLFAEPAVAPATVLGVAAALLSPLWPDGAAFLAWLAGWAARWLVLVARTGAGVPAGSVPWPGGATGGLLLGALTLTLLCAGRYRLVRRLVAVTALGVALGAVPVRLLAPGWPAPGWVFVACDVGQGDALVLRAGEGEAVLVDAGPDPDKVDGCLRRLGVRTVALAVVSHFHADHVNGLPGVLPGRRLGAVLVPEFAEPGAGAQVVRTVADRAGAELTVPAVGAEYQVGDVRLRVVGPTRRLTGTRSDPNENSLVVLATVRGVRILLAGDAETEEQHELAGLDLRADVLKVAHHGSAYQDGAFLAAVSPAVAVVSVGVGNGYGHPNQGILDQLGGGGAQVARTDRDGDIAVSTSGAGLTVTRRSGGSP
ncbi:ComEC/Rec2 family competence protein [Longispora sp. K20-0274]|uniref:ComEC/Rec2 family competence protein n=1 Tax=Longispora sp. K20-0274 TaxID=3088255 RepID=UPI00399AA7DD